MLHRSRSASSTCARPSGATHEADAADLAPGRAGGPGRVRDLRGRRADRARCRSSSCSTCSNERLVAEGREPVAFDSDCREGICGSCGLMIDGQAHGPQRGTATCQLHLRLFNDGDTVVGRAVPQRRASRWSRTSSSTARAFDRIIEAGGFITAPTGSAPDANLIAVPKDDADRAMDAAACIGCGACVAACPNGAGQLFTAAKLAHLNLLPQGQPERQMRTLAMVEEMERWFGSCTNHRECEAACPKEISIDFIAMLHRDYRKARRKLVNAAQIDRLLSSIPANCEERHRKRVLRLRHHRAPHRRPHHRAARRPRARAARGRRRRRRRPRRRGGRRGAAARPRARLARARPAARGLLAARRRRRRRRRPGARAVRRRAGVIVEALGSARVSSPLEARSPARRPARIAVRSGAERTSRAGPGAAAGAPVTLPASACSAGAADSSRECPSPSRRHAGPHQRAR